MSIALKSIPFGGKLHNTLMQCLSAFAEAAVATMGRSNNDNNAQIPFQLMMS